MRGSFLADPLLERRPSPHTEPMSNFSRSPASVQAVRAAGAAASAALRAQRRVDAVIARADLGQLQRSVAHSYTGVAAKLSASLAEAETQRASRQVEMVRSAARIASDAQDAFARTFERQNRLLQLFQRLDAADRAMELEEHRLSKRLVIVFDPLVFGLGLRAQERMIEAGGPEPVIELLGAIVLDQELVDVLALMVRESDLGAGPREELLDGIKWLQEGHLRRASLALTTGAEGALHDLSKRRKLRERKNAAGVGQILDLPGNQGLLLAGVFTHLNARRHGKHEDYRRDCVLAVLALLVWAGAETGHDIVGRWLAARVEEAVHGGALPA